MADEQALQFTPQNCLGHCTPNPFLRIPDRRSLAHLILDAMSEIHSLTRIRQTDYICDHCGEGRMIFTGASWEIKGPGTHPIGTKLFCHRCEICGMQVNYMTVYPRTEYLPEANQ